jgi:hypothetical protein
MPISACQPFSLSALEWVDFGFSLSSFPLSAFVIPAFLSGEWLDSALDPLALLWLLLCATTVFLACRKRRQTAICLGCMALLLFLLGIWDLIQAEHSVLRNYPVIGHVRWLVEMIRPEILQYLLLIQK